MYLNGVKIVGINERTEESDMKAYICKVKYENSAVIENKILLVLAENEFQAANLCEEKLCKHYDESIKLGTITEVDTSEGLAYIVG